MINAASYDKPLRIRFSSFNANSTINMNFSVAGSLIPFSLRLIHAELPQHNGRPQETLDRSYRLIATIKPVLFNLENRLSEQGEEADFSEDERAGTLSY